MDKLNSFNSLRNVTDAIYNLKPRGGCTPDQIVNYLAEKSRRPTNNYNLSKVVKTMLHNGINIGAFRQDGEKFKICNPSEKSVVSFIQIKKPFEVNKAETGEQTTESSNCPPCKPITSRKRKRSRSPSGQKSKKSTRGRSSKQSKSRKPRSKGSKSIRSAFKRSGSMRSKSRKPRSRKLKSQKLGKSGKEACETSKRRGSKSRRAGLKRPNLRKSSMDTKRKLTSRKSRPKRSTSRGSRKGRKIFGSPKRLHNVSSKSKGIKRKSRKNRQAKQCSAYFCFKCKAPIIHLIYSRNLPILLPRKLLSQPAK